MKKFFLDIQVDGDAMRDAEGQAFPNAASAEAECIRRLWEAAKARMAPNASHHLVGIVRNGAGREIVRKMLAVTTSLI